MDFKHLAEMNTALAWMAGTDGDCVWFNSQWLEFTGRTLDQERGDGWLSGVHPEDKEACIQNYRTHFRAHEQFLLEYRLRRHDGQYRWILDSGAPVFDTSGAFRGYNGICFDIHERKSAEDELRIAAVTFEAQHGLVVTDSDWLIIRANHAFRELTGLSPEAIRNRHLFALLDETLDSSRFEEISTLVGHQGQWSGEVHMQHVEGYPVQVLLSLKTVANSCGAQTHVVASFTDISERMRSEEAIRLSGHRYQAVLASTIDGFWLVDRQGKILEANDAYCRFSGYSLDELLNSSVTDIDAIDDCQRVNDRINEIALSGGTIFESWHRRKNGSVWPVEVSISYSDIQGGRFFCFIRDITERKTTEQLSELRQQLADWVPSNDHKQLLQSALEVAEQITDSQIAFFHYVEADQESVTLQTWSPRTLKEMCYAKGDGLHYPISDAGVWVDCVHQRGAVIYNDYESLSHKKGLPEGHSPLSRILTVPVLRDSNVVAVIGVGNKKTDYTEADAAVVSRLADMTYDFVERQQAEKKIQFMAFNDVLTGLPNRQLLADRLQQAILMCKRSPKLLAVGYLDLDGFKPINDRLGHHAGDQLLVQFAQRMQHELREGDTLARLGGDEFAFLLNGLDTIQDGEKIINRILQSITVPFEVDNQRVHISASVGLTFAPNDPGNPDALLRHADQAMYRAKQDGKNTYRLFDPIELQKVEATCKAISEFELALAESQLFLHFQPRIDLRDGTLAGLEALVRWHHPHKGLLYPDQFLSTIESTPLECALDEWVLRAAVEQHLSWRAQGLTVAISVNISPRLIQQPHFPRFLEQLLAAYPENLAPYLELEVLETSAIGDTTSVAEIMDACVALGVMFSLDDFGTGYSSLTYFHRLPVRVLKIDKSFVRDMLDDPRDQSIVEGVLRLADALDRPVVAEGVETIELGMMLASLGCRFAQGYGIARPMPGDAVINWHRQWERDQTWHYVCREAPSASARYDLDVAIFSHRLWAESVREYVDSGFTRHCPKLDDSSCLFSRWYLGIGAARYGNRPSYPFILAKHDAIHQLAQDLITTAKTGNPKDITLRLENFNSASEELANMLNKLSAD